MAYLVANGKYLVQKDKKLLTGEIPPINNWYLPPRNEMLAMRDNLYEFGVGDLSGQYWCSTQYSATNGETIIMNLDNYFRTTKLNNLSVRPGRFFESNTPYNLRDVGPAGGFIYLISGNTYYEAAPADIGLSIWSDVSTLSVGTTSPLAGSGPANDALIINQPGHTTSAALLCENYSVPNP